MFVNIRLEPQKMTDKEIIGELETIKKEINRAVLTILHKHDYWVFTSNGWETAFSKPIINRDDDCYIAFEIKMESAVCIKETVRQFKDIVNEAEEDSDYESYSSEVPESEITSLGDRRKFF